jgi:phosphatidylglycerophosphatase A
MSMPEAAAPLVRPPLGVHFATVLGIGHLRPASGTWASIAAGALGWAFCAWAGESRLLPGLVVATIAASVIGLLASPAAIRHFARRDPSQVVIDEVAGTWAALACIPAAVLHREPFLAVAVAVLWFRVFDIAKPWPVGWLERLPGAWGIMVDDLAAGLLAGAMSAAVLH